MASTENDILNAIVTAIKALTGGGAGTFTLDPQEIALRKKPFDLDGTTKHWYPGITVSRGEEGEFPGTNEEDDIGYGAQVTMVVNNDANPVEDDIFADWRQKIRKTFIHQRISGLSPFIYTCLIEPGPVYKDVPNNYDVSALVIRVLSRETRTIS